jgi:hypothetical protein
MREAPFYVIIGSLTLLSCAEAFTPPMRPQSPDASRAPEQEAAGAKEPAWSPPPPGAEADAPALAGEGDGRPLSIAVEPSACSPANWASQKLPPLLARDGGGKSHAVGKVSVREERFDGLCSDSPEGAFSTDAGPVVIDGVRISAVHVAPAGKSGRNWKGNHCQFEVGLTDGTGVSVLLGADRIPPFNTINAVLRSGSAVWLSVGFNGYTREFPKGGNRVIALDLCDGRVVWQSKDSVSNGGLLLLDDYLISAYGFTAERRYVFVLDARSGGLVQKLPVVETVCPSKEWAPHWQPGERCDAPGQAVGAATHPRIEDGVLTVDTNTGSATFPLTAPWTSTQERQGSDRD